VSFSVNSRAVPPVHRWRPVMLFALFAVLAGCGPSRAGGSEGDPAFAMRDAAGCRLETLPERLPAPGEIVDTAALSAGVREIRSSYTFPDGHVVLTMFYQADGLNIRRDLVEHSLPPMLADSVQKLVFASRREVPEASREWGVRLVIDLGERISYRIAHREYCPPRPRNPELESRMRSFFSTGPRFRGSLRERDVVVRVAVLPSGIVGGARVIRGADSGSQVERELATYVRQFAFQPATIDGYPIHGEIDLPVRIRDR
jgi:hypothetical protein